MSSQRKMIRKAAAEILKMNPPVVPNVKNIFSSRATPAWEDYELPAVCVYATREAIEIQQEAPRMYKRDLELRVEVLAGGRHIDDALDDIGDAIERRIGRSDCLTYANEPQVDDIMLTSQQIEFSGEGSQIQGALVITYTATYYTYEPDECAENPVDDLDAVDTEYNLAGEQDEADVAEDLIEGLST